MKGVRLFYGQWKLLAPAAAPTPRLPHRVYTGAVIENADFTGCPAA
jgi:hypothetical protein